MRAFRTACPRLRPTRLTRTYSHSSKVQQRQLRNDASFLCQIGESNSSDDLLYTLESNPTLASSVASDTGIGLHF
jgi:hypothetical protein